MQETQVRFLSWEDPLEKGITIHSSILAWRIPMDRGAWWVKLVHTLANPGWSDDLSQYFSECTGQEALGGRDMELVEEMGGDF